MKTLTCTQLFNMRLSEGYFLFDIRTEEEYKKSHILSSCWMPLTSTKNDLEKRYKEILEIYCPEILDIIIFIIPCVTSPYFKKQFLDVIVEHKFSFLTGKSFVYFHDIDNFPDFLIARNTESDIKNIINEFNVLEPYPSEILSGIYLGNRENAYNSNVVHNLKLTHILSLNQDAQYDQRIAATIANLVPFWMPNQNDLIIF